MTEAGIKCERTNCASAWFGNISVPTVPTVLTPTPMSTPDATRTGSPSAGAETYATISGTDADTGTGTVSSEEAATGTAIGPGEGGEGEGGDGAKNGAHPAGDWRHCRNVACHAHPVGLGDPRDDIDAEEQMEEEEHDDDRDTSENDDSDDDAEMLGSGEGVGAG